jgi:tetratricopeptide (TPR) repeat protein
MTGTLPRSASRRRWALTLGFIAAVTSVAPTHADESSDTLAARQRYRAGAAAYASGHYADAVEQFLAADRLAPSAALSFDAARAYEKLGEPSLALRWYRDYLRRAHDAPDAEQVRRTVRALQNTLRDKGVQQVTIRSTPRGATVAIDGEPVGVTPWSGDIPPGRHRATLAYEGYARTTQSFVLPPAEAVDVDVELTPEAPASSKAGPAQAAAPAPPAEPPPSTMGVAPPPVPEKHSSATRTVGIVVGSVGAAALGGALAAELVRESAESSAKKEKAQLAYSSQVDTMEASQTAARVLLGVGSGLLVTGAVLFVVGAPRTENRAGSDVALGCTGRYCGATFAGRF